MTRSIGLAFPTRFTRGLAVAIGGALLVSACGAGSVTPQATSTASSSGAASGGSPSPTPTLAPETVKVIVPIAGSLVNLSLFVADQNKFFANNGLIIDLSAASGGGPDIQALIAGDMDFDIATSGSAITAVQQGQTVFSVMAVNTKPVGNIVMRKDVAAQKGVTESSPLEARIAALNGMKVGVSTIGSFFSQMADFYIKVHNLKNVQVIAVGGGPTALAALDRGTVDALIYSPPVTETAVLQNNAIWLVRPSNGEDPALNDILMSSLIVRADFLQKRPETVRRMTKSLVQANQWIKAHSVDEIAQAVKPLFATTDPAILKLSITTMKDVVSADGCATQKGLDVFEDFLIQGGVMKDRIPFAKVVTNDYLPSPCK